MLWPKKARNSFAQDAERKWFARVVGLTKGHEMNFKMTAAAAIAALLMAGGAQAATCSSGGVSFTLNPDEALVEGPIAGDPNPDCIAGNDDGNKGFFLDGTLWGITDWIKADKIEEDDRDGDETVTFTGTLPAIGGTSGDWTVTDYDTSSLTVTLVLKSANNFGAFLLDGEPLTGTWATSQDLSHASLWYSETGTPSTIPLPAAGWLLLAGIGGLAAFRRRKSV